jgi:rhamnogalacturonyl hydrolase YesR
VVTQPGQEKSYLDSSSTALFTYSLKGARLGCVDPMKMYGRFVEVGRKAYEDMTDNFRGEGGEWDVGVE